MKYIFIQPQTDRFVWELLTACKSLVDLGVDRKDIVILFTNEIFDRTYIFESFDVHVYNDEREVKWYTPSIRPYLWWKYLEEDISRSKETYVYLDSDVVITDLKAFDVHVTPQKWACSDCNNYINYDYIKNVFNGELVLDMMSNICNVPLEWVKEINDNSGGAQWVICEPSAEYWEMVYKKSIELNLALSPIDTTLQKWTAEMWAQLWCMYHFNVEPKVEKCMDFAWSCSKIEDYNGEYIIHNAGIDKSHEGAFLKGLFQRTPTIAELTQKTGLISDIYVEYVKAANYGN